jgi:dTDP-glucose 4,6-dehydratase
MSNINLTKIICQYLDEKLPKAQSYFEQVTFIEDRLGHDLRYAIDSKHISNTKGFFAKNELTKGIPKTIDWYIANNEWVKRKLNN